MKPFLLKTGFCIFLFTFGKERSAITAECKAEEGVRAILGVDLRTPAEPAVWQYCCTGAFDSSVQLSKEQAPKAGAASEQEGQVTPSLCPVVGYLFPAPTVRGVRRNEQAYMQFRLAKVISTSVKQLRIHPSPDKVIIEAAVTQT